MNINDVQYKKWLSELKRKICSTQIKAAVSVNTVLIQFYRELGKMISEQKTKWGSRLLETCSKGLCDEFPKMEGFSVINLKYCRLFFMYFNNIHPSDDEVQKSPQAGDEFQSIPPRITLSLRDLNKPVGVSEFIITDRLPETFKSTLLTIKEIEDELNSLSEN